MQVTTKRGGVFKKYIQLLLLCRTVGVFVGWLEWVAARRGLLVGAGGFCGEHSIEIRPLANPVNPLERDSVTPLANQIQLIWDGLFLVRVSHP